MLQIVFSYIMLVPGTYGKLHQLIKYCDLVISSLSCALYHHMTKPSRADDTTANTTKILLEPMLRNFHFLICLPILNFEVCFADTRT